MILEELFPTVADFRDCVPGISATIEFKELNSSAISAKKQIQGLIPSELYDEVKEETESPAKLSLRVALGNLTMHKAIIFDVINKRIAGNLEVYKHELETIQRQYIDNYFNAMDSLIREFETDPKYKSMWQNTPEYKLRDSLQIKNTADFNCLYGIDMSYLFFFRTIPLQSEILDDFLTDYFVRIQDEKKHLETRLRRALAMLIVSLAMTRFDVIELPATIRNLFSEQKSQRQGSNESSIVNSIAATLHQKAMDTIKSIDLALTEPSSNAIDSDTSFNHPDDKIYLIS